MSEPCCPNRDPVRGTNPWSAYPRYLSREGSDAQRPIGPFPQPPGKGAGLLVVKGAEAARGQFG